MPWLGFFNKISKADIYVVLDHVENNPRDAAFWCRRVKMLIHGNAKWISMPLKRPESKEIIGIPINRMEINTDIAKDLRNAFISIENSYKRYPYFEEVSPLIQSYFDSEDPSLLNRNMEFNTSIFNRLNINSKVIFSSSLKCEKKSTELLIEIVKKLNGTQYLSGDGADGYQQGDLYKRNDIQLIFNKFQHPVYPQKNSGEFVPGLSIIDCLMNNGFEQTEKICKSGMIPPDA
jgi:hypothetical protein